MRHEPPGRARAQGTPPRRDRHRAGVPHARLRRRRRGRAGVDGDTARLPLPAGPRPDPRLHLRHGGRRPARGRRRAHRGSRPARGDRSRMSEAARIAVRRAGAADAAVVAGSLARAFDDDPVLCWVFPDAASRPRRMERLFALAAAATAEHGEVWISDDGAAAALWEPPARRRPPLSTVLRMGLAVGTRTPLALRGLRRSEARHPRWPHWYLSTLGTDPP